VSHRHETSYSLTAVTAGCLYLMTMTFPRTKWFAPECSKLLNWFANTRKCVAFCDANHLIFITDLPTPEGWMEGWVDVSCWLHTEMVYPPADGHPSKYWPGPMYSNFASRGRLCDSTAFLLQVFTATETHRRKPSRYVASNFVVFYFTIMLLNNYAICFVNIMSVHDCILRTCLRTQSMANLL